MIFRLWDFGKTEGRRQECAGHRRQRGSSAPKERGGAGREGHGGERDMGEVMQTE